MALVRRYPIVYTVCPALFERVSYFHAGNTLKVRAVDRDIFTSCENFKFSSIFYVINFFLSLSFQKRRRIFRYIFLIFTRWIKVFPVSFEIFRSINIYFSFIRI